MLATIDYEADWVQRSIEWHRQNGTLAKRQPYAAYDSTRGLAARDQTMPNSAMLPRGGYNHTGRDQPQPPPTGPMSKPGSFTRNFDQGEQDDETGFTPEQLAGIVEICLNKFAAQDAEGETDEHSRAMRLLAGIIAARHSNGNGRTNGDRGMRSGNRMRTGDRRPAQDAAIRSLNTQGFFQRFPEARNIRLSANGRY
jgi:hypothetical protein